MLLRESEGQSKAMIRVFNLPFYLICRPSHLFSSGKNAICLILVKMWYILAAAGDSKCATMRDETGQHVNYEAMLMAQQDAVNLQERIRSR